MAATFNWLCICPLLPTIPGARTIKICLPGSHYKCISLTLSSLHWYWVFVSVIKLNHLVPTQFPLPNLKLELCLLCQGLTTTLQKIFFYLWRARLWFLGGRGRAKFASKLMLDWMLIGTHSLWYRRRGTQLGGGSFLASLRRRRSEAGTPHEAGRGRWHRPCCWSPRCKRSL